MAIRGGHFSIVEVLLDRGTWLCMCVLNWTNYLFWRRCDTAHSSY